MLNEERIKLMTRMASFEENEGKKSISITEYFRSDYVGFHMLKTAGSVTLAFVLVVGIRLFCRLDEFISEFYETDFVGLAEGYLREYLVVLLIYLLFAYILYSYRYTQANRDVKIYQKALKKLRSLYERQ